MNTQTMQASVALARGVKAELGAIVHTAERTVILLEGLEASGMEENQLRNVLDVARDSHSVPMVVKFIQYQIGRARVGKQWQHNGFGLQVISDIEETVAQAARRAANNAAAQLARRRHTTDEITRDQIQASVHEQLMTNYLGFLYRAFVYVRNVKGGWNRLSELVAQRTSVQTELEENDA